MSLIGTSPILIIKIYKNALKWRAGATTDASKIGTDISLKDWQEMSEIKKDIFYTPIPIIIPLDEKITSIASDDADQTITFDTTTVGGEQFQSFPSSTVKITLRATKNNTVMMLILAALKQLTGYLSTQRYSITLYYDSTFVLDGKLSGVSQATVQDTNIKVVVLNITEKPYKGETTDSGNQIQNTAGTSTYPEGVV